MYYLSRQGLFSGFVLWSQMCLSSPNFFSPLFVRGKDWLFCLLWCRVGMSGKQMCQCEVTTTLSARH